MLWYQRVLKFWKGERQRGEPFFLNRDMQRPYTYGCAMADLHFWFEKLSVPKPWPGLHGLRVEGNNLSKDSNGVLITDAHGGWHGLSSSRYDRINLLDIALIPSRMLNLPSKYADSPSPVRNVFDRGTRTVRKSAVAADLAAADKNDGSSSEEETSEQRDGILLPHGYSKVVRSGENLSRSYSMYVGPLGTFYSRPAVWRAYDRHIAERAGDIRVTATGVALPSPVSSVSSTHLSPAPPAPSLVTRSRAEQFEMPASSKNRELNLLLENSGRLFGRGSNRGSK